MKYASEGSTLTLKPSTDRCLSDPRKMTTSCPAIFMSYFFGCSLRNNLLITRMHSSRMRTACSLTIKWGRGLPARGVSPRGCLPRGVPCDLSHHAFDVTCMLPQYQLRHINSAPAYILLPGYVTCKACWDTPPPPVDRQTLVKT